MWALIVITLLANSTYPDAVEVVRNYNTQIECDKKLDKTINKNNCFFIVLSSNIRIVFLP